MMEIRYCTECHWRGRNWYDLKEGFCKHPSLIKKSQFDYKQPTKELYPYCTMVNVNGFCPAFRQKIKLWRRLFNAITGN